MEHFKNKGGHRPGTSASPLLVAPRIQYKMQQNSSSLLSVLSLAHSSLAPSPSVTVSLLGISFLVARPLVMPLPLAASPLTLAPPPLTLAPPPLTFASPPLTLDLPLPLNAPLSSNAFLYSDAVISSAI